MLELKQVIILRKDLKMSKGKAAAQASHAAVSSAVKSMKKHPTTFNKWWNGGQMKVVLAVDSKTNRCSSIKNKRCRENTTSS
jgi:PTH2 family peptidyl-tRNA hydrolase